MGRIHPRYCEHEKMIDGGSFYEHEEVEECQICERQASQNALWLSQREEIAAELHALRQLRDDLIQAYEDGLSGRRALRDGIIPLVNRAHKLNQ